MKKILFIDNAHPFLQNELEKAGFVCDYFADYNYDDFSTIISIYTGIIIRSKIKLDRAILEKAKNLKFIGRVGAGMESIDIDFAVSNNIKLLNSPEGNRDAVGEHAIGMLLMLMNKLKTADTQMRNNIRLREENRGTEIKGKTIAIIGYGNMGSAFARKLNGFEANVIAYDKYKFNYSDDFCRESSMEEVFETADILSLHVPLTEETTFMVNKTFLNKFKKNIYFVNTSRGKVVKTDDLVDGIKKEKVLGVALDVLEYEGTSFDILNEIELPEAYHYLIHSDRTVLTPHIAGWTEESKIKLAQVLVDKIISLQLV